MAVRSYTRKRDGATVYQASYYGPKPERRKVFEKVRVVAADAKVVDHTRARNAAAKLADDRRLEIENGAWVDPRDEVEVPCLRFDELVDRFLKGYRTRSGDMTFYQERAKPWLEFFRTGGRSSNSLLLRQVDVPRVTAFRDSRMRSVSVSTLRKDLTALSTLFRWARVNGITSENPASADLVRRPQEPPQNRTFLRDSQVAALIASSPPWLVRIVRWAIGTGMDRKDILALSWDDVDERAGTVYAPRGKTGAKRYVYLNETLSEVLRDCKRLRRPGDGNRVFLGPSGRPPCAEGVKGALRRAYNAAGFTVSGQFKIFRHTFASRLAMAGHGARDIAELMGHTTTSITDRYMHLSPGHLKLTMQTLDDSSNWDRVGNIERRVEAETNPSNPKKAGISA